MLHRYSFFCVFALLLTGLHWWAKSLNSSIPNSGETADSENSSLPSDAFNSSQGIPRRELLEALDRLVVHEKYYHSIYGHYTKVLSRIGFTVPHRVARQYEVRVVEATESQLLVSAFSEEKGKTFDVASIDQNFQLEINFPRSQPRAEYLKLHAYKHLRLLTEQSPGQTVMEEGVFTNYFRYESRPDSKGRMVAFAIGVKPPVLGVQLDSAAQETWMGKDSESQLQLLTSLMDSSSDWDQSPPDGGGATGENSDGTVMTSSEEAHLAQQIFKGEMGRYARNWTELERITHFNFEDQAGDRSTASVTPSKTDPSEPSPSNRNLIIEPIQE